MICFGPWLYRSVRRAGRPDAAWVPTNKSIIKKLISSLKKNKLIIKSLPVKCFNGCRPKKKKRKKQKGLRIFK